MQVKENQWIKSSPSAEKTPQYWRTRKNAPSNQAFNSNLKRKGK